MRKPAGEEGDLVYSNDRDGNVLSERGIQGREREVRRKRSDPVGERRSSEPEFKHGEP
jgi:hypothetical protein